MAIDKFTGKYYFLSNFYKGKGTIYNPETRAYEPGEVFTYKGIKFDNGQAAFQSQKNLANSDKYSMMYPIAARYLGTHEELRDNWEDVKEQIMYDVQMAKFSQCEGLKRKLLETGNEEIIKGNWKHDNYWGHCYCPQCKNIKKENKLGLILMQVREVLRRMENGERIETEDKPDSEKE